MVKSTVVRGRLLFLLIKVSKLALYPGHTLGGAPSGSKPELAGVPEGSVRCGTKRTIAHVHVRWLLESQIARLPRLGGGS